VSQNPEKQLEEFLASKPTWMQRFLQMSFGLLSPDDIREWGNNLDEAIGAKDEYERILQQTPDKWKEYRKRQKQEAQPLIQSLVPKATPGRKLKSELAEQIWALDAEGKTNQEILQTLRDRGVNLSLEAVESYLKKRRRARKQ
jgi:hypothetical protein